MSDLAEDLLQRSVERLGAFSRAAFGVGLTLTRAGGAAEHPGPAGGVAFFPRPVGLEAEGRHLLVADGSARREEASEQVLLDDFLDMAAALLGSLAGARDPAALEPLREELWRDLLGAPTIVGVSPVACALRAALPAAANSREPLFLAGETGSGRRSLAAAVHRAGPRCGAPFIAEDIALIPPTLREHELFGADDTPGLIAEAAGGTIYLAGIEHLAGGAQTRLLKCLAGSTGAPAPARIVSSADADLEDAVRRGRFHRDLADRLTTLRLAVPPLRQRPEDIPLIAAHLLRRRAAAVGGAAPSLTPEALEALKKHVWAGNVRELDAELARAGAGRTTIRVEDLQPLVAGAARNPDAAGASSLRQAVSELEVGLISQTLDDTNWNKSRAARILGLSRLGLQKKIDRYGIDRRR